jgi:hypothetical protein
MCLPKDGEDPPRQRSCWAWPLPTSIAGILGCVKHGWIRQLKGTLNG